MKKFLVIVLALLCFNVTRAVEYRLDIFSEWGSGWADCYLTVSVNGTMVLEPVSVGESYEPFSYYFSVNNGDEVFVDFFEGMDGINCQYFIYDELGTEVASSGMNYTTPEDITFVAEVPEYELGFLEGVVADPDGSPVQMAKVHISNSDFDFEIYTDKNGKYSKEVITTMGAFDIECQTSGLVSEPVTGITAIPDQSVTTNIQLEALIGDRMDNPIWIEGDSYTHTGNTSDFWDDYEIGISNSWSCMFDSPDVVYAFTLEEYKSVNVSMNFTNFESQVAIFEAGDTPQCLNQVATGDIELTNVALGPGTYYIVLDGKIIEEGIEEQSGTYTFIFNLSDYVGTIYSEDFEDAMLPVGWKIIDANGDTHSWEFYAGVESFDKPYSGVYVARFKTFMWPSNLVTSVDEWLITRALMPTSENSSVRFQYRAVSAAWPEIFQVRLSTTGTDVEDFDVLLEETEVYFGDTEWRVSENDLSDYVGQQVYIAVVCISTLEEGFMFDVDAFELPYYVAEKDLAIKSIDINPTPITGKNNTYKVHIKNLGQPTADYVVKLMNTDGAELASATGTEIPTNAEQIINLQWNPDGVEESEIYAVVETADDENSENNESLVYTVNSQLGDQIIWSVGNENNGIEGICYAKQTPISMSKTNSISKTVYPAYDMPGPGTINTLIYQYFVKEDVIGIPVTVYMGEIAKSHLTGETILAVDLEVVYTGDLDFYTTDGQLVIPLDTPYDYQGGNLVVMFHREPGQEFNYFSNFITSPCRFNTVRSQMNASNEAMDPNDPNQPFGNVTYFPNTKFVIEAEDHVEVEKIQENKGISTLNAYPNPFSTSTTIEYELDVDSYVDIRIYNLQGQLIKVLDNSNHIAGLHTVEWDGRNLPEGVYICKLNTGGTTHSSKVILVK